MSTFADSSFACSTNINKEVELSSYSLDAYVIDSTAKTNLIDFPVEVIVVIDAEDKSQILSLSSLQYHTLYFINFYN